MAEAGGSTDQPSLTEGTSHSSLGNPFRDAATSTSPEDPSADGEDGWSWSPSVAKLTSGMFSGKFSWTPILNNESTNAQPNCWSWSPYVKLRDKKLRMKWSWSPHTLDVSTHLAAFKSLKRSMKMKRVSNFPLPSRCMSRPSTRMSSGRTTPEWLNISCDGDIQEGLDSLTLKETQDSTSVNEVEAQIHMPASINPQNVTDICISPASNLKHGTSEESLHNTECQETETTVQGKETSQSKAEESQCSEVKDESISYEERNQEQMAKEDFTTALRVSSETDGCSPPEKRHGDPNQDIPLLDPEESAKSVMTAIVPQNDLHDNTTKVLCATEINVNSSASDENGVKLDNVNDKTSCDIPVIETRKSEFLLNCVTGDKISINSSNLVSLNVIRQMNDGSALLSLDAKYGQISMDADSVTSRREEPNDSSSVNNTNAGSELPEHGANESPSAENDEPSAVNETDNALGETSTEMQKGEEVNDAEQKNESSALNDETNSDTSRDEVRGTTSEVMTTEADRFNSPTSEINYDEMVESFNEKHISDVLSESPSVTESDEMLVTAAEINNFDELDILDDLSAINEPKQESDMEDQKVKEKETSENDINENSQKENTRAPGCSRRESTTGEASSENTSDPTEMSVSYSPVNGEQTNLSTTSESILFAELPTSNNSETLEGNLPCKPNTDQINKETMNDFITRNVTESGINIGSNITPVLCVLLMNKESKNESYCPASPNVQTMNCKTEAKESPLKDRQSSESFEKQDEGRLREVSNDNKSEKLHFEHSNDSLFSFSFTVPPSEKMLNDGNESVISAAPSEFTNEKTCDSLEALSCLPLSSDSNATKETPWEFSEDGETLHSKDEVSLQVKTQCPSPLLRDVPVTASEVNGESQGFCSEALNLVEEPSSPNYTYPSDVTCMSSIWLTDESSLEHIFKTEKEHNDPVDILNNAPHKISEKGARERKAMSLPPTLIKENVFADRYSRTRTRSASLSNETCKRTRDASADEEQNKRLGIAAESLNISSSRDKISVKKEYPVSVSAISNSITSLDQIGLLNTGTTPSEEGSCHSETLQICNGKNKTPPPEETVIKHLNINESRNDPMPPEEEIKSELTTFLQEENSSICISPTMQKSYPLTNVTPRSEASSPATLKSRGGSPAALMSGSGSPATSGSRSGSPAVLRSRSSSPTALRSSTGSPAVLKLKSGSPAAQRSSSDPPAALRSRSGSPADRMSRSSSPIEKRSKVGSLTALRSRSGSPTTLKSRNGSPIPIRSKSGSPPDRRSRSGSPTDRRSRSGSPTDGRSRCGSATDGRSRSGSPTDGRSRSGSPSDGRSRSGSPTNGRSRSGSPTDRRSRSGSPTDGRSRSGSPTDGRSRSGSPTDGKSRSGSPTDGRSRSGSPTDGRSRSGSPTDGKSRSGSPTDGRSRSGSPIDGRSRSGFYTDGRSRSGSPTDGRSRSGSPTDGRSRSGSPTDGRSRSGSPTDGRSRSGSPKDGRSRSGSPADRRSRSGSPTDGRSRSGSPTDGRSRSGSPTDGRSRSGSPTDGRSRSGSPTDGRSKIGSPTDGRSRSGSPTDGRSRSGSPKDGRSKIGSPTDGRSRSGSPTDGRSKIGSPTDGRSRSGSPTDGRSRSGSPTNGRSRSGSPTDGRSRSGSPVTLRSRNGSPVPLRSKSGSSADGRSRSGSPATVRARSGSPATMRARSGSPVTVRARSGSPSTVRARSGSPATVRARSGSPATVRARSGSPATVRARSGSPVIVRARSGSPATVRARSGSPVTVRARNGSPAELRSSSGSPAAMRSESGSDSSSRRGSPTDSSSRSGSPTYTNSRSGSPTYSNSRSGSPTDRGSSCGSPGYTSYSNFPSLDPRSRSVSPVDERSEYASPTDSISRGDSTAALKKSPTLDSEQQNIHSTSTSDSSRSPSPARKWSEIAPRTEQYYLSKKRTRSPSPDYTASSEKSESNSPTAVRYTLPTTEPVLPFRKRMLITKELHCTEDNASLKKSTKRDAVYDNNLGTVCTDDINNPRIIEGECGRPPRSAISQSPTLISGLKRTRSVGSDNAATHSKAKYVKTYLGNISKFSEDNALSCTSTPGRKQNLWASKCNPLTVALAILMKKHNSMSEPFPLHKQVSSPKKRSKRISHCTIITRSISRLMSRKSSNRPLHISENKVEIFKAAKDGNLKKLRKLIQETGPFVTEEETGNTLLHAAVSSNQVNLLLFLLKLIDPNITNKEGHTPAHVAALKGHTQVLRILLSDEELSRNKRDNYENTYKDLMCVPLLEAILEGNKDLVHDLLRLGADPDCKVGHLLGKKLKGQLHFDTPRQLALILKQEHISDLFPKDYGKGKSDTTVAQNSISKSLLNTKGQRLDGPPRFPVTTLTSPVVGSDVYKMDSKPRGFVCILDYNTFNGRPDLGLKESREEVLDLASVFQNMGYAGHTYFSLTGDQTKEVLTNVRDMELLDEVGCAVFVISSHATREDNFLTSDLKLLGTEWIMEQFRDSECPKLKGKPKLFIFDLRCGCFRNQNQYLQVQTETKRFSEPLLDMVSLNSTRKVSALGTSSSGSFSFIMNLCTTLAHHSHEKELGELYLELLEECGKVSTSAIELNNFGFVKKFFFNPVANGHP